MSSDTQERTVGDAFGQVGEELADVIRREFEQMRSQAGERARAGAKGTALLAAAGAAGAVSAAAVAMLPLMALRRVLGPAGTALVVAAGSGGLAAYLATRGLDELGDVAPAEAERVREAARDAMQRAAP